MSNYERRLKQSRQYHAVAKLAEKSPSAPLHDLISTAVSLGPDLTFEYFQIAFSDCSEFRLESQAEIDSMLMIALQRRGVTA